MARTTTLGKHQSTKFVFICVALLGFALIADLLWASSSSSSAYLYGVSSSNWPLQESHNFIPPHLHNNTATKGNKDTLPQRVVLSATFADLPAPELEWEEMAAAPVPRLDGAALQIKDLLFVFAGYGTIDYVSFYTIYLSTFCHLLLFFTNFNFCLLFVFYLFKQRFSIKKKKTMLRLEELV